MQGVTPVQGIPYGGIGRVPYCTLHTRYPAHVYPGYSTVWAGYPVNTVLIPLPAVRLEPRG